MRGVIGFFMVFEVGMILEGKVTGITKFGAFISLEGGKTGMVHISEVAPTYVSDIREHLQENQTVKVKVLSISEDGKIALSIKKALPKQSYQQNRKITDRDSARRGQSSRPGDFEWHSSKRQESSSFEDMLSKFKQTSDEKISNLKRGNDSRRTGHSKKGNQQKL